MDKLTQQVLFGTQMHHHLLVFYSIGPGQEEMHLDPSCFQLLGFESSEFTEKGLLFYYSLFHHDDHKIISGPVRNEMIRLLRSANANEFEHFVFSFNFRIRNCRGEFIRILQRCCVKEITPDGNPASLTGFLMDISNFKEDDQIIFTIEKTGTEGKGFNTLLYRQVYQPGGNQMLSQREKQVIHLIRQGCSSKEIAQRLFISPHTVNNHRKKMLEKTGAGNSAELVKIFMEQDRMQSG